MKKILFVLALGLTGSLAAQARDAVAQMTFRVTDDFGNVVTNAPVSVSTFKKWIPGDGFGRDEHAHVDGVTDTNGTVTLKIPSKTGDVRYSVFAAGTYFDKTLKMKVCGMDYYKDRGGSVLFKNNVDRKWQPWNPTVDLVVKRVLNPVPMYAQFLERSDTMFSAYNTPVGYDLMKGDWVSPYGKGEISDFIFSLDCQLGEVTRDQIQYFDATMHLTFSNEGDGIQEYEAKPRQGSVLRLPRFAPDTGYKPEWAQKAFEHKDASNYGYNENQNYIYRVRTKKDDEGCIVSALYGKIQGPISFSVLNFGAKFGMKYYLNPTPNDRNLEFDLKQNLFKNLPSREEVQEP